MGDIEPESAITSNEASLPMEGLEHQPSHKILDPQFILPTRCVGLKRGAEFEGRANEWLVQFEIHALKESPTLTLLMIFCYTCSQESTNNVIREASPSNGYVETHNKTLSGTWRILRK